jgi:phospholipase/lecithinase/hemolysin
MALVVGVGGIGQADAQTARYSGLYVFGDSLVDSGNAFYATGGAQASAANGYFNGRFSNGLNFADYLGIAVAGGAPAPFALGGTNVSVGGALAETRAGETSPSFRVQLDRFTGTTNAIANDALVLVTFGGNDVRATATTGGTVSFDGAIADLDAGLRRLYTLGARNFVITGVPDISQLPSAQPLGAIPGRLAELNTRSVQLNGLIGGEATTIDALSDTSVTFFDFIEFQRRLYANPAAYGLPTPLNTTTPCQIVGGGSPQTTNCANSVYFDGIHPTTIVHRAVANELAARLNTSAVPEPASWLVMVVGVGLVGGTLRRRAASGVRVRYA